MFGFENTDRLDVIQLYCQKYIDSNFNIQRYLELDFEYQPKPPFYRRHFL